MKSRLASLLLGGLIVVVSSQLAVPQTSGLQLPKSVEAGAAFSIQTTGSGNATLYIVGLGQVLRREVQLGQIISFAAGDLQMPATTSLLSSGARPRKMGRSMSLRRLSRRR
jgi:hypothetical protein